MKCKKNGAGLTGERAAHLKMSSVRGNQGDSAKAYMFEPQLEANEESVVHRNKQLAAVSEYYVCVRSVCLCC